MSYAWNRKTLIALLATMAFATVAVGCGPKSGGSNDRPADQTAAAPAPDSDSADSKEEALGEDGGTGDFDPYQDKATIDGDGTVHTNVRTLEKQAPTWGSDEDDEENEESAYEVIEKDRIYGQNDANKAETYSSNQRFGEFGAVLFNDKMWKPGLPDYPAGHPRSKIDQIFTGGVSENRYQFTDGKSDDLMAYAVEQSNLIPNRLKDHPDRYQPDVLVESRRLAERIQDVFLYVDTYNNSNVHLEVAFADGDVKTPVKTLFKGKLDALRLSKLKQVNIKGDLDLTFEASIMCMDKDGGCQNAIIQIAQVKGGKICRMAYVVHRSGDAHLTIAEEDRLHYTGTQNPYYEAMARYFSNTAYNSCLVNKHRRDFPNRLTQHLKAYCGDSNTKMTPAARTIGYRTWASAYGASAFALVFEDEPQFNGDNSMAGFVIQGPLVYADNKNPIYSNKLTVVSQKSWAKYIGSAHLVNNDAGGNLNILLRFGGTYQESLRFSATSLLRQTVSPKQVPVIEQLPEDPRG